MSFRQAPALADAIQRDNLDGYEREHRAIRRGPHAMSLLLLMMDRWPAVRRMGMQALAAHAGLFEELLVAHDGDYPHRPALRDRARLGWRLLTQAR